MFTKITIPISLILCFVLTNVSAQNQTPVLSNISVVKNDDVHSLTIGYDVDDAEEENLKITLQVTDNTGRVLAISDGVKGDVGFPIRKGSKKSIFFTYPTSMDNIENFTIKLIADDLYKIKIDDLVAQVDSVKIKAYLTSVYGNRYFKNKEGFKHKEDVKDFIFSNFESNRLKASKHEFIYDGNKGQNIIGEKTGAQPQPKVYILCGHFDTTKKSPGADDNGSGIAGLMEAARILSQYNYKNTIRFIGFDFEEMGLIGSKHYVFDGGLADDDKVDGVINYDMIGIYSSKPNSQIIPDGFEIIFPDAVQLVTKNSFRGDFVVNTCNNNSKSLQTAFTSNANTYVPALKVLPLAVAENGEMTPNLMASDHFVFWKKGYKALHIGDGGETRNPFLDTPKDVMENINYTFMSNIIKTTIATFARLAEIEHTSVKTIPMNL